MLDISQGQGKDKQFNSYTKNREQALVELK
jgi:hypothetical protein